MTSQIPDRAEFGWPDGHSLRTIEFKHRPPQDVATAILEGLATRFPPVNDADTTIRCLFQSPGPSGSYEISNPKGSWFVRVTSRAGRPELEKSLVSYLASRGASVCPPLLTGVPIPWRGWVLRADVLPVVRGHHFTGTLRQLSSLATSIKMCHRALAVFPGAPAVRAAAVARYERLGEARDLIRKALVTDDYALFHEHAAWAKSMRDWLAQMVDEYVPRLDTLPGAQCVHGEIHPGNVIFTSGSDTAVLVDFEEAVHMFTPPTWDLAWLAQRFCLRDNPSPRAASRRLEAVADAYGGPLPRLTSMMRQAAWQSLATIVAMRVFENVSTPSSECQKFVRLERQAQAYEAVA